MRNTDKYEMEDLLEASERMNTEDYIPFTFHEGNAYYIPNLYGNPINATVTDRTNDTVTLTECWIAEDTGETVSHSETYKITMDEHANEQFEAWKYHGHRCMINTKDYL